MGEYQCSLPTKLCYVNSKCVMAGHSIVVAVEVSYHSNYENFT